MRQPRPPIKITLDAYAASHRAVADRKKTGAWPMRVGVRSNKYLNHTIEPDHRRVKQRLRPMRGLQSYRTAAVVIRSIALVEKIQKGQFQIGKLGGATATMPEIWRARPRCVSRLLPIDEANTTHCPPSPKFAPEPSRKPVRGRKDS
jgi:hypothetical protein